MSGESSLRRYRCPDTLFAITGVLNGAVISPFYTENLWSDGWMPPKPQSPSSSSAGNWFADAGLYRLINARARDTGLFEAQDNAAEWSVETALDLRGYSGSFTIVCIFTALLAEYAGPLWAQGDKCGISFPSPGELRVAFPFETSGHQACGMELILPFDIPSDNRMLCASTWNAGSKSFNLYLQNRRLVERQLPDAATLSGELSCAGLKFGGGSGLKVVGLSMFSTALQEESLAVLNYGLF